MTYKPHQITSEAVSAPNETKAKQFGANFDSKYTRYECLGSGGIASVYRAKLNSLGLSVAIKEIKELFAYFNFLQRSEVIRHLREAVGQMAQIHHFLIIKIIDQNKRFSSVDALLDVFYENLSHTRLVDKYQILLFATPVSEQAHDAKTDSKESEPHGEKKQHAAAD